MAQLRPNADALGFALLRAGLLAAVAVGWHASAEQTLLLAEATQAT